MPAALRRSSGTLRSYSITLSKKIAKASLLLRKYLSKFSLEMQAFSKAIGSIADGELS